MSIQLDHSSQKFIQKKFPIVIVCDGVQSPANIGALFRICDAMGVSEIIFGNSDVNLSSTRLKRTARNTDKKALFSSSVNLEGEIQRLKNEDYTLIALEITKNSLPLQEYDFKASEKIALVIGNETRGVSKTVLEEMMANVHIEMFGENSSMNVIQATSIALHWITYHLNSRFE